MTSLNSLDIVVTTSTTGDLDAAVKAALYGLALEEWTVEFLATDGRLDHWLVSPNF